VNKLPQAKVPAGAQKTETGLYCVYNATRGCRLNSKITIADSAREPLKVLKVFIEGLARDGESSLWLTPLVFTPNIMRLFPFDFAYLDSDLKVIEAVGLPPGIPLPQFNSKVASALIVPFDTFSSTGTCAGDQLIVCVEDELDARIADITAAAASQAVNSKDVSTAANVVPFSDTAPAAGAFAFPKISLSNFPGPNARGTGSTLAMTPGWQIATSTSAAVLPEPVAPDRIEAPQYRTVRENSVFSDAAVATSVVAKAPKKLEAPDQQAEATTAVEPDSADSEMPEPVVVNHKNIDLSVPVVRAEQPTTTTAADASQIAPVVERRKLRVNSPAPRTTTVKPAGRDDDEVSPIIARAVQPDSAKEKIAAREKKKKESLGILVKRFLNCEDPLPERRSIIRLLSKELVAFRPDDKTKSYEVRDVSPGGLYLRTQERWRTDHVSSLILKRKDAQEENYESRVIVQVRTVRCDESGVGLSWIWPDGVEFQPWKRLHTKRSDETDADYFVRELRLTAALGFLRQICPSAVEEIKVTLHQRLSNKRVASAVEIALQAQELLPRCEDRGDKLAHSDMVRRVLENGSWTEDNWIRQWWAGLLASSCSPDGLDTSNTLFIDLLAKLTPVHLRVLSFVCRKEPGQSGAGDPGAKTDLNCTADELIEAVGSHSLARIQQTMGQLSSLGLITESSNPSYVAVTEKGKTRISPTALALKMHARCAGQR